MPLTTLPSGVIRSRCGRCTRPICKHDREAMKNSFTAKVMIMKLLALIWGWLLMAPLTGAVFAAAAGQEDWEGILQAARKEGKVSMIGPVGADRRDALTIAFEKKYGISVEYHADSGAGILPRLGAERKADRYLWDLVITGTTTGLENLIPAR